MKLFYLFPALLGLVLISSCGKIEEPRFEKIEHFRIKSLGLDGTTIGFDITFYNPNHFGLTVKEAACDIYIDSVYAGKFSQDQEITVSGQNQFSIPLTGNVPLSTALKLDINKLVNRDIFFRAKGSVKMGKGGIFITKPFDLKGTRQLKM